MKHPKVAKMLAKYPQVQWVALDIARKDVEGNFVLVMGRASKTDLEKDVAWYRERRPNARIEYVERLPN